MHVSGIPYVVNIRNPKPPLSQKGCGAATLSQKSGMGNYKNVQWLVQIASLWNEIFPQKKKCPLKRDHVKRKGLSSNHHFSEDMLVQLMVSCWFGFVLWDSNRGTPKRSNPFHFRGILRIQTTRTQTNNYPLVDGWVSTHLRKICQRQIGFIFPSFFRGHVSFQGGSFPDDINPFFRCRRFARLRSLILSASAAANALVVGGAWERWRFWVGLVKFSNSPWFCRFLS